jgi:hypothetical protein
MASILGFHPRDRGSIPRSEIVQMDTNTRISTVECYPDKVAIEVRFLSGVLKKGDMV